MINTIVSLFVVMLLAACGDSDPQSIPPDAEILPDGPECNSEEGALDTCTGETICIESHCVPAFPRMYGIAAITATMPINNAGASWDGTANTPGYEPDTYLTFSVNEVEQVRTPTANDSFQVSVAGPFTVTLAEPSELTVRLWDDDGGDDALAKVCPATLTAADLRDRPQLLCPQTNASPGTAMYRIEPLP